NSAGLFRVSAKCYFATAFGDALDGINRLLLVHVDASLRGGRMKYWLPATGLAAFLVGCASETTGPTRAAGPPEAANFQLTRYVVVFQDNTVNPAGVTTAVTNQYGLRADHVYLSALQGFTAVMSAAAAANLARDPRVKFVEADQIYKTTTTQSPTPSWGLDRI